MVSILVGPLLAQLNKTSIQNDLLKVDAGVINHMGHYNFVLSLISRLKSALEI